MSLVFPLRGWRYDPNKVAVGKVLAPPYDIIDAEEQKKLYERDDRNVIRLILGKSYDTDNANDNKYTRAAMYLDTWRKENIFIQDKPAIYVLEQVFTSDDVKYTRRGFLAKVKLVDWGKGIYPHEKTLAGPKKDRLELMQATRGNLEPIFGLVPDSEKNIFNSLANLGKYDTCIDVFDDAGVENKLWVVDNEQTLNSFLANLVDSKIFIADGHHRYETALNYRNEVREKMARAGQVVPPIGELECDYILMLIVPDSEPGLVVWPTHRVVYGIENLDIKKFLKDCEEKFSVESIASLKELKNKLAKTNLPAFGFVAPENKYYLIELKNRKFMDDKHPEACDAWKVLDVSVLHSLLLDELLHITEEKLLRKENINYYKSIQEVLDKVNLAQDGEQCGFILKSTPMSQVRDISEVGAVMPQKSTYFYPKPLSGMVLNLFW